MHGQQFASIFSWCSKRRGKRGTLPRVPFPNAKQASRGLLSPQVYLSFHGGSLDPGQALLSLSSWSRRREVRRMELFPFFLPSPRCCLVPKIIEQHAMAWADHGRVCSAASLPKTNTPAPRATWDRQEENYARSRQAHFPPPLNPVIFASKLHP